MVQNRRNPLHMHPSRDYLDGLEDFWAGRPRTAIEHLTKILADKPEHLDRMPLYRLWIEVLAEEQDLGALRSLADHLVSRSQADHEDHEWYFCLRGLIALELDEFQGALLMVDAVQNSLSPYAQELKLRVSYRQGEPRHKVKYSTFVEGHLVDYFHAKMVATRCFLEGETTELKKVLAQVKKRFSNAPLMEEINLFAALDDKNFTKAYRHACLLREQYPVHPNYGVYAAFAAAKLEMIPEAVDLLQKALLVCGENDPDIVAMLGYCYDALFQHTNDPHHKDRCFYFLTRAQNILEKNGFGSAHLNAIANNLASDLRQKNGHQRHRETPSAWVVKLSARHFHELKSSPEDEVKVLARPLGDDAQPGDIVFVVADDYARRDEGGWRIGAVYTVESEPRWHPVNGKESLLRLVSRPEVSIPISIAAMDHDRRKNQRSTGQVWALDHNAFAKVTEAIEEYQSEEHGMGDMLGEFSRVRGSS